MLNNPIFGVLCCNLITFHILLQKSDKIIPEAQQQRYKKNMESLKYEQEQKLRLQFSWLSLIKKTHIFVLKTLKTALNLQIIIINKVLIISLKYLCLHIMHSACLINAPAQPRCAKHSLWYFPTFSIDCFYHAFNQIFLISRKCKSPLGSQDIWVQHNYICLYFHTRIKSIKINKKGWK